MIVGLLGGKGAGKSTAARYLAEAYGAKVYALANELKELLRDVFELSEAQLHGSQGEKETIDPRWGVSPRQLMERQGDALRRVYGNSFQVDRVLAKITADAARFAVISDVRYPWEVERIRSFGDGMLWRLNYAPGLKVWSSFHGSENYWRRMSVDHEIRVAKTGVEALYAALDVSCRRYGVNQCRNLD